MTSPIAVIGLKWHDSVAAWLADPAGGYDLQRSDLDLMFAITEGLDTLPAVRGDDQLIPFRTGRLPAPRIADHRPVVATGWVTGRALTPAAMYRAYVDELKGYLDPMGPEGVLVATLESGEIRRIICVPRNIIGGNGLGSDFRAFSIEWDALDPFWYRDWGAWALDSGLYLDDGLYADEGSVLVITPDADPFDVTFQALGTTDGMKVLAEVDGPVAADVGVWNVSFEPEVGFSYPFDAIGPNLVPNPGFETSPPIPSGTSQYGLTAAVWQAGDGADGSANSLDISVTGPGGLGGYGLPEMTLVGPRLVRIRAWVRNPGAGSPTARLYLLARRAGTPAGSWDYVYGSWAYDPPDSGAWSGVVYPSIDVVQLLDPDVVAGFVRLDLVANPAVGPTAITHIRWDDIEVRNDDRLLSDRTLAVDSGERTVRLETGNARGHLTFLDGNRHGEYIRLRPGTNTIRIVGRPEQVRLTFPATYL